MAHVAYESDPGRTARRGRSGRTGEWLLLGLAAAIWLAVVLIPVSYAVIQTFKTQQDALVGNPWSLGAPWSRCRTRSG